MKKILPMSASGFKWDDLVSKQADEAFPASYLQRLKENLSPTGGTPKGGDVSSSFQTGRSDDAPIGSRPDMGSEGGKPSGGIGGVVGRGKLKIPPIVDLDRESDRIKTPVEAPPIVPGPVRDKSPGQVTAEELERIQAEAYEDPRRALHDAEAIRVGKAQHEAELRRQALSSTSTGGVTSGIGGGGQVPAAGGIPPWMMYGGLAAGGLGAGYGLYHLLNKRKKRRRDLEKESSVNFARRLAYDLVAERYR
jgi:hypothetical protein